MEPEGEAREGHFLLGSPTFVDIGNGRLRCVETGHELPSKDADDYSKTKACRVALIDAALAGKKPPINMFKPDPLSKSKLICKLTGDNVNKTEEHIWKHITGRRFLNKLKQKEEKTSDPSAVKKVKNSEKESPAVKKPKKSEKKIASISLKKTQKKTKSTTDDPEGEAKHVASTFEETQGVTTENDMEEPEFWVPPVGDRWDFDNGKDRWASSSFSEATPSQEEAEQGSETTAVDLSARTKRMSIAVGPSSCASRKKKRKENKDGPGLIRGEHFEEGGPLGA